MRSKCYMALLVLLVVSTLLGCATIMGKSAPESVSLKSNPEGANVVILDESGNRVFEGKTPTIVSLEKKKGYFKGKKYTVKISKPGFTEQAINVDTRLNGWYIGGNLIFGGLIGWLIVDPATGAMWTLDTNEVNVNLEASKQSQRSDLYQIGIILLDDVPQSLRGSLVKIDG